MRDLTFFTSNPIKLSHARHIAESFPVKIIGFRQRTFHAGYDEPRLHSRREILQASYESAKEQLKKANLSPDSHPFILEDTSVRISALSDDTREVPGVDIKYWMEGRTFTELDELLGKSGGSRQASVRSDVLLHIPNSLKVRWQIDAEFIVFTGIQEGFIIDREFYFQSNLVFPWLDNQSFSKWFCPNASGKPLGSLPIEVADKFDFRRKSFVKLFNFLISKGYLSKKAEQMRLPLESKPITFVLCGFTCAGKTTVSQYLSKKFGFLHLEASDFMHLSYHYRHGFDGEVRIGDFAESALSQKPLIAAEKVVEFIRSNPAESVVVSGFRSPSEVEYLKREMKVLGRQLLRIFLEARPETRFKRLRLRQRPGDDLTFEQFCERDQQQERMGLIQIHRLSGVSYIKNDGTLQELFGSFNRIVEAEGGLPVPDTPPISKLENIRVIGLENAILLALLSVWKDDEARDFFTTTEIAKLISRVMPNAARKHKDNVSRYFNQDFYPYYEISRSENGRTHTYRLSNTGYGIAIRTLRAELEKAKNFEAEESD